MELGITPFDYAGNAVADEAAGCGRRLIRDGVDVDSNSEVKMARIREGIAIKIACRLAIIQARIWYLNKDARRFDAYQVKCLEPVTVSDALQDIKLKARKMGHNLYRRDNLAVCSRCNKSKKQSAWTEWFRIPYALQSRLLAAWP